jgi:hypothetical protein
LPPPRQKANSKIHKPKRPSDGRLASLANVRASADMHEPSIALGIVEIAAEETVENNSL